MRNFVLVTAILLAASASHSETIYVPIDQPTIQDAINVSNAGDTILIACGTYYEADIDLIGGIRIASFSGDPECVTIDAQASQGNPHIIFNLSNLDDTVRIQGLTFTGGWTHDTGGAINCYFSPMEVVNCFFVGNRAENGGAIRTRSSDVVISGCLFIENQAEEIGALFCSSGHVLVRNCNFLGNYATGVSAISGGAGIEIQSCIIAYNEDDWGTGPIYCGEGPPPLVSCTNIYGNDPGDWIGCVEGQAGLNGNISVDPQFCGVPGSDNYYLQSDSPCAPGNHPDEYGCGLIGALPVGCGTVSARKMSWGSVKSMFNDGGK